MLTFVPLESAGHARDGVLRHTHLVGPDNVPVAGDIRLEGGLIVCAKGSSEAAGLSIQVDLDRGALDAVTKHDLPDLASAEPMAPLGSLTLQTCLLPERDRPYLLSVELARYRLMLLLNKLEEWQLFDLSADHPVMRVFEQARAAFTNALVAQGPRPGAETTTRGLPIGGLPMAGQGSSAGPGSAGGPGSQGETSVAEALAAAGYPPHANAAGVRALWLAVQAGERLALEHAARDFAPRVSGRAYERALAESPYADAARQRSLAPVALPERTGVALPYRPAIGATVSPDVFSQAAQDAAGRALDFIQTPMRWIDMEPSEGKYAFKGTDQWIEWAVRKARLPITAGPLIDFRPTAAPEWLYIWENDYDTLRELVHEHVRNIVTRYRRTVTRWVALSGIHVNENFRFGFEQMMDMTRICVAVVRKLHPAGKVFIELTQPWGEYYTSNRRSLPPLLYAEMVAQAGILIDGFSVRVQVGSPAPGASVRDLLALSAQLDRFASLEKPIAVVLSAPSQTLPASGNDAARLHPGEWHAPWSPAVQADWLASVASLAAAKSYVHSVCWADLADGGPRPEVPTSGLLDAQGNARPALAALAAVRDAVTSAAAPEVLTRAAGPRTASA